MIPTYCRVPRVGNTDNTQTAAAGQTGRTPKTITKLTISDLRLTTYKCSSIEVLRKSEETVIGISERFHDGFNIGGSYVTVGNFHEFKEVLKSGYDQGVNIVKEVCNDFFWDSFLGIY